VQSAYITEHLPQQTKHESILICPSYNLRKCAPNPANESLLPLTGKLRYLADRTRWDVCTTVALRQSRKQLITYGGLGKLLLFCFNDASYITEGTPISRHIYRLLNGFKGHNVENLKQEAQIVMNKNHCKTGKVSCRMELYY